MEMKNKREIVCKLFHTLDRLGFNERRDGLVVRMIDIADFLVAQGYGRRKRKGALQLYGDFD